MLSEILWWSLWFAGWFVLALWFEQEIEKWATKESDDDRTAG